MAGPTFSNQNFDHIPIPIYCSRQIMALAPDCDEELIDLPDISQAALYLLQRIDDKANLND